MAMPRSAAARAGRVVDAVADHRDCPWRRRSSSTAATLSAGSRPARTSSTPACAAMAAAVVWLSPVSSATWATPASRSPATAPRGVVAQRVADGDDAEGLAAGADGDGGLALGLEPLQDGCSRRASGAPSSSGRPTKQSRPSTSARTPRPAIARKRVTGAVRAPVSVRMRPHAAAASQRRSRRRPHSTHSRPPPPPRRRRNDVERFARPLRDFHTLCGRHVVPAAAPCRPRLPPATMARARGCSLWRSQAAASTEHVLR